MVIFLKNYRKAITPRSVKRPGYIDRSSLEEDMRSAQWAHVEQLMQSLNTTWGQASRLITRTPDQHSLG